MNPSESSIENIPVGSASPLTSILDPSIETFNEIHPLEIFQNMLNDRATQAWKIYDNNFEYK